MEEWNNAPTECLNILYEISHPQKKKHKRTPYKKGKHSIYAPTKAQTNELIVFGKQGIMGTAYIRERISADEITEYFIHEYLRRR